MEYIQTSRRNVTTSNVRFKCFIINLKVRTLLSIKVSLSTVICNNHIYLFHSCMFSKIAKSYKEVLMQTSVILLLDIRVSVNCLSGAKPVVVKHSLSPP